MYATIIHALLFKIIYTNSVLFLLFTQELHGFKTCTMMVYMILNGKGFLTAYGLHGCSFVSFFFNRSIQYSWLFLNKIFTPIFSSVFLLGLSVKEKRGLHYTTHPSVHTTYCCYLLTAPMCTMFPKISEYTSHCCYC